MNTFKNYIAYITLIAFLGSPLADLRANECHHDICIEEHYCDDECCECYDNVHVEDHYSSNECTCDFNHPNGYAYADCCYAACRTPGCAILIGAILTGVIVLLMSSCNCHSSSH